VHMMLQNISSNRFFFFFFKLRLKLGKENNFIRIDLFASFGILCFFSDLYPKSYLSHFLFVPSQSSHGQIARRYDIKDEFFTNSVLGW